MLDVCRKNANGIKPKHKASQTPEALRQQSYAPHDLTNAREQDNRMRVGHPCRHDRHEGMRHCEVNDTNHEIGHRQQPSEEHSPCHFAFTLCPKGAVLTTKLRVGNRDHDMA